MAGSWPSIKNVLVRYDVHIYFDANDSEDVKSASTLQNDIKSAFPDVSIFPLVHKPIGPHLQAQFEAHVDTAEQVRIRMSTILKCTRSVPYINFI